MICFFFFVNLTPSLLVHSLIFGINCISKEKSSEEENQRRKEVEQTLVYPWKPIPLGKNE